MEITKEFLEQKIKDGGEDFYPQRGNIYQIADNIFKMYIWNCLAGGNPHGLDGHYVAYVNSDNFKYVLTKHADYGSLTYYHEVAEKTLFEPHKSVKKEIEAFIAEYLLGAYQLKHGITNMEGENLFESKELKHYEWGQPYYEGKKRHIICNYYKEYPTEKDNPESLGYISPIDQAAINYLK